MTIFIQIHSSAVETLIHLHSIRTQGFVPPKEGSLTVNPVRKSSTFQRDGSHGALNPVFAQKKINSSPLQAPIEAKLRTGQTAGLSNGVKASAQYSMTVDGPVSFENSLAH